MTKMLFSIMLLMLSSAAFAQLNPPHTIALVPPGNNLENENQIEALCPKTSPTQAACRKEKLAPKTWTLKVYEKPEDAAKTLGEIQITGTPGKGLQAKYVKADKSTVDFPSDSKGDDWGYSCFFEFTVKDMKGDWVQLPQRPFAAPVWINIRKDWPKNGEFDLRPEPRPLDVGTVYTAGDLGNIVITKFTPTEITFRKENPTDMSCGEDEKKVSPEDLLTKTKPTSVLFDKDGHLLAWPAYCRGC